MQSYITFLGGTSVAGQKLKEAGTAHWATGNTGTNSSNFTGLPGGSRDTDFESLSNTSYTWINPSSVLSFIFRVRYMYYIHAFFVIMSLDFINNVLIKPEVNEV